MIDFRSSFLRSSLIVPGAVVSGLLGDSSAAGSQKEVATRQGSLGNLASYGGANPRASARVWLSGKGDTFGGRL